MAASTNFAHDAFGRWEDDQPCTGTALLEPGHTREGAPLWSENPVCDIDDDLDDDEAYFLDDEDDDDDDFSDDYDDDDFEEEDFDSDSDSDSDDDDL